MKDGREAAIKQISGIPVDYNYAQIHYIYFLKNIINMMKYQADHAIALFILFLLETPYR